MEEQKTMTLEQILDATIRVIGNIMVPVALKDEISDKLGGCLQNLAIAKVMYQKEKELWMQKDEPKTEEEVIVDEPNADV